MTKERRISNHKEEKRCRKYPFESLLKLTFCRKFLAVLNLSTLTAAQVQPSLIQHFCRSMPTIHLGSNKHNTLSASATFSSASNKSLRPGKKRTWASLRTSYAARSLSKMENGGVCS